MTLNEKDSGFLEGYQWPVLRTHAAFLHAGFFDNGSTFHAHKHMFEAQWKPEGHSVLVHSSKGTMSTAKKAENLEEEVLLSFFTWPDKLEERFVCKNGTLMALLVTGNILEFRKQATLYAP
jgi:hypothetical protein